MYAVVGASQHLSPIIVAPVAHAETEGFQNFNFYRYDPGPVSTTATFTPACLSFVSLDFHSHAHSLSCPLTILSITSISL